MRTCFRLAAAVLVTGIAANPGLGQQFIGSTSALHTPLASFALNPALVGLASGGTNVHLGAFNALGGTNAFNLSKDFVSSGFPGGAQEGDEYSKNLIGNKKRNLWGNFDVLGPAAAFQLKENLYGGVYTRVREVVRGGNLETDAFRFLGSQKEADYGKPVIFNDAGFSVHSFAEVGISLGKEIKNDYYSVTRIGATVKYLMGMNAGTLFSPQAKLLMNEPSKTASVQGEVAVLFSKNASPISDNDITNDPSQWFNRNGKGGLGLDLGFQYEFHPEGDPNRETPYSFSFSAALTDVGAISYDADTGSAVYSFNIKNKEWWQYDKQSFETVEGYFARMVKDSILSVKEKAESFRMGLPTALRLGFDWRAGSNFFVSGNLVLNLRGSATEVYRPSYVNVLNVTPRYEKKNFMIGLPFTMIGYQSFVFGASVRVGPLFIGSNSLFSTLMLSEVRNLDAYAGLSFRLQKKKSYY